MPARKQSFSFIKYFIEAVQSPCALVNHKGNIIFRNKMFSDFILQNKSNDIAKIFNFDFQTLLVDKIIPVNKNYNLEALRLSLDDKDYLMIFLSSRTSNDIKLLNHDMNNILTSILNGAISLKNDLPDKRHEHILSSIENSVLRASSILESYLSPELKLSSVNKNIDLIKLINEVINSLISLNADKAKISFSYDSKVFINGNYNQVFRAIQNICINSIEAIKSVGNIELKLNSIKGNISDKLKPDMNYAKITIKDNGCGIKKSDLNKIFEAGFSTKNKNREAGLGLSGIKNILATHNGLIEVNSKVAVGTEFNLYFPMQMKKHSILNNPDTKIKIIVADDEDNILELLTDLFLSYDFEVAPAKNGIEVLKILEKDSHYDFLIIDRKMPQLDGIECLKKIREQKIKTRVILTTGSPSVKLNSTMLKKLGVIEILSKPYDFNYLLELIRGVIS